MGASYHSQKVHGQLEQQGGLVLSFLEQMHSCQDLFPCQKICEGNPLGLPLKSLELPSQLPVTMDSGQKDDKVPDQLKNKGGEGRQFLVDKSSDLDQTHRLNLTATLWGLLAQDPSTAMVAITGTTLLSLCDLEKFYAWMVLVKNLTNTNLTYLPYQPDLPTCLTYLLGQLTWLNFLYSLGSKRAISEMSKKTRGEMTQGMVGRQKKEQTDAMMANLCHARQISMLAVSAILATIFLSGAARLNDQPGIDINNRITGRTRMSDHLKRSFIEVTV